jgi:tRNA-dependent cyclodipeptide synthase
MSPGNSYFKDYEVRFLLKEAVERFGRCVIMVADVPAIATYVALGYPYNRARNKAIPKGNNLKNRTRRLAEELGYTEDQVRIIDWANEVEDDPRYTAHYEAIVEKYRLLPFFSAAVRQTSREVLEATGKIGDNLDAAVESATHYLLSELAFLEFAPEFFAAKRVCYVYHRNWPIYENYLSGHYDRKPKPHLDFLLLEAPYETYISLHNDEVSEGYAMHDTYSRIMQSGILRAAFVDYPPVLYRHETGFSGIFYEIITTFANKHQLKIEWVEETGYGVVIEGLSEGRFDIFCSATWPTPERHRHAALSYPAYYSNVGVWVRADSPLAQGDWLNLDHERYRIAITEGDITHAICLTDFVRARWVRMPQLGRVKALLDAVANGSADATIAETMTYEAYAKNLSSPLVNISKKMPIRRYANCFLVAKHQNDFVDMLNDHILSLHKGAEIKRLVEQYVDNTDGIFFPTDQSQPI